MIKFLSSFAKTVGLSIVIVSILEMILPNNKTKKYIRVVMGIFILFNIISPFVNNKELFNIENLDLEKYYTSQTNSKLENEDLDQTSMNNRIKDLYIQEIEKDIENKLKEKGYKVIRCNVNVKIGNENEETKISKIDLEVDKSEEMKKQNEEEDLENKIITEVQKIKKIDISVNKKNEEKSENESRISKTDIQNIKKFLIEEYGVSEECLQIN